MDVTGPKKANKFWNDFHTKMMFHTHADTLSERETTPYSISRIIHESGKVSLS